MFESIAFGIDDQGKQMQEDRVARQHRRSALDHEKYCHGEQGGGGE